MGTKDPVTYDELCQVVSTSTPSDHDPVTGAYHFGRPTIIHEHVSYQRHPAILCSCKKMCEEGKEVLYRENKFLTIAWDGRTDILSTQSVDYFEGLGIMTKWTMSVDQFATVFGSMPGSYKPAVRIGFLSREIEEVRLLCLDDLDLAVRAMYAALRVPSSSTLSKSTTRLIRPLRPTGSLKITIADVDVVEALVRGSLLPWLGDMIIEMHVEGLSMLQDGFFVSEVLQRCTDSTKAVKIASPCHLASMKVVHLERRLHNIESQMHKDFDLETIAQELLSIVSFAIDIFRSSPSGRRPSSRSGSQFERVLTIAAWYFSRLTIPEKLVITDTFDITLDLKRHQLLLAIAVTRLPCPSTSIPTQEWKIHTHLQSARLAYALGNGFKAEASRQRLG